MYEHTSESLVKKILDLPRQHRIFGKADLSMGGKSSTAFALHAITSTIHTTIESGQRHHLNQQNELHRKYKK